MIEMKVKGVTIDEEGNFSVLLIDDKETKVLPVGIGNLEAQNILLPIEGIEPPRPLTPDLLKAVIERLGAELNKIIITKIENNTYFAEIHMIRNGEDIVVDSRPSDAIALALRSDIPIFMKFVLTEFTYNLSDVNLI